MTKPPDSLATAIQHHQAGRLQQAEQIYRQILQADPQQPDALYFLGVIAHQNGQNEVATDYLRRAVQIKPDVSAFHNTLATVYLALGELDEAVASCQRALRFGPDYAEAHHNLGIALQTQGKIGEAVASYRQALILKPESVETLNNLGGAYQSVGKLEEAATHYQRALELRPEYVEAHNNLANVRKQQGRLDEAVAGYRRALEIRPDFPEVHNNLGMVLQDQGKVDEAMASFQQALQIRPQYAEALNNLGCALSELGKLNEAVSSFHRALQTRHNYAEAFNNLGNTLRTQGRYDQAVLSFNRALQINPDFAAAHSNLGSVLQAQGSHDEALASFRRALEIKPDFPEVLNNLAIALEEQGKTGEAIDCYRRLLKIQPHQVPWELRIATLSCPGVLHTGQETDRYRRQLEAEVQRLAARDLKVPLWRLSVLQPPLNLMYHGRNDRPIKEAYANLFRNCFPQDAPTRREGLPRVGFVVTRGHEGIFLRLMRGILEHIRPGLFESVIVCANAGAAEIRSGIDNQSIRILIMPERFDRIVDAVRAARFDLLYYWEVGTDAVNYFLPFFRLAPVQCTSWGTPVTSGIPQMDYYLSSELLEPGQAADHYSEELVEFATLPTYYYRPEVRPEPGSRDHFGLAEDRHLYFCPHTLLKFHPQFDRPLAEILRRDPQGEIVLIGGQWPHLAESLRRRLDETIPDGRQRIRFLPWHSRPDFLHLTSLCDVLLDPFPFGGGNITYEALALGLPIVTMPSEYMRGRVTYACYQKMGLPDCVASDPEDYVNIAVRLATDRDYRDTVRSKIHAASDVLFEDLEAVRELERFFQRVL